MQTHLKGFGLENFRVFKDYTWFDFAPITILTGPNSSGKSSLNKALLLLKDNFEKGNLLPDTLTFNANIHGLISATNSKCRESDSKVMSFTLPHAVYHTTEKELREWRLGSRYKPLESPKAINLLYNINYQVIEGKAILLNRINLSTSNGKPLLVISKEEIFFDVELYNSIIGTGIITPGLNFPLFYSKLHNSKNITFDDWFNENNVEDDACITLRNQVYKSLGVHYKYYPTFDETIYPDSFERFYDKLIVSRIADTIEHVSLLANNRTEQKRVYTEEHRSSFKNMLELLQKAKNDNIPFQKFINKCSDLLGIDGFFDIEYDNSKQLYYPNINGQSFTDYGFGYTQIASLIFKISELAINSWLEDARNFVLHEPSILILEEPESNLHPKFQSILADIVVDAAERFSIQFIIETHSEYLIRKLQYLTAKKTIKPEDSVIYYFHEPHNVPVGQKQVKKIEIQEDGSLSDEFGPGFFDEAATWKLELLRLKNARNN